MRVRTPPPAEGAGQRRAGTDQGQGSGAGTGSGSEAPMQRRPAPPASDGKQTTPSTTARPAPGDATAPAPAQATAQPQAPAAGAQDTTASETRRLDVEAGRPILIGSAPGNQVVVDDAQVAPQQARIDVNPKGQTIITDLAHNGATLVNGIPVQRAPLMSGAEVRLGQRRFIFTGHDLVEYDAAHDVRVDALHLRQAVRTGFLGLRRKVLLDDISLTLLPGTFVAIVGASGAGKTTLLRALSGQAPARRGNVLYNGLSLVGHRHEFCNTLGYVPQDDIVHKNLTVEKALYYAGRLRLPKGTPRREVWDRVDEVLDDVELTEQRRQLISQLSGGQRKRVNIALELLGHPAIFYLDEPTSGRIRAST